MRREDEDAIAAFVVAHGPSLKRTALLLTADHHAAEDLVQTVLAKAALRWSRVSSAGEPVAYVHRMLVNASRSQRRRRRVREVFAPAAPPEVADPDVGERRAVLDALGALPPRQRAVVVLRYYEDFTEARTAEVLGCSVSTVKSQNRKALATLRAALATEFGPARADTGGTE